VVDHSVLAAPNDLEQRTAYGRLLQQTKHVVDHLLWSHPFEREAGSTQLMPGNDFNDLMHLFDVEKNNPGKHRIQFCILVDIELGEIGVVAPGEVSIGRLADRVLSEEISRTAPHEPAGLFENRRPQAGVE